MWGAESIYRAGLRFVSCRLTEMSQPSPVSLQITTAEQNRAEQNRAEQSRAEQSRAEQKGGGARERGMEGTRERGNEGARGADREEAERERGGASGTIND